MSSSHRKGYKLEKRVADDIGGTRLGILGKVDVINETFGLETKYRKKLPASLKSWYAQAVRNCPPGRHPGLILKEKDTRMNDALVILRYKNFLSCFIKKKEE